MHFPRGFGIPLVDFALFVLFAYFGEGYVFPPERRYRWFFAFLCFVCSLLFFIAWIVDLGAHIG